MIGMRYDKTTMDADIRRDGGNLITDEGLETAVLISYGTDRRAEPDDAIPDGTDDRRGWWGDILDAEGRLIGSRFWLLDRSKTVAEVERLADVYAREALRWMLDDGVAGEIMIEVERQPEILAILTQITRPGEIAPRWQSVWEIPYAI